MIMCCDRHVQERHTKMEKSIPSLKIDPSSDTDLEQQY